MERKKCFKWESKEECNRSIILCQEWKCRSCHITRFQEPTCHVEDPWEDTWRTLPLSRQGHLQLCSFSFFLSFFPPSSQELGLWTSLGVCTPLSESLLSKTTLWFSLEHVHSGLGQGGTYLAYKTWQFHSQRWVKRQFIKVQIMIRDPAWNGRLDLP